MSSWFRKGRKKALFFDMNNTLVDRRQCFHAGFIEVLSQFTARWEADSITEIGTPEDALLAYKAEWSKRRKQPVREPLSSDELRFVCLRKALEPYPLKVSEAFSRAFFQQVEMAEEGYVTLFPHVLETLEKLSGTYRLAIISNGRRDRLESNLARLGLDRFVPRERLFSSERDGPRKPHPDIFHSAMRAVGIRPQEGVMIGNSWKQDIVGAVDSGMDAVWIHPAGAKKIAQRKLGRGQVVIIRAFHQLQTIL
ncbi:HAD family hydrolase [Paenibacillus chartarius]|uniref:HAD family hydrolase n=1 Tax=Paenibacillus chartarius TaxID=747481 RepID=A0ABV6DU98_9BACL